MKFDVNLVGRGLDLRELPALARSAEEAGFDAIWIPETANDPFMCSLLAGEHTNRVTIGTAVAIAFPRSPMTTAYLAWDLAGFTAGRFVLGLGTQVKGHIERRFGTKWDEPVPRLREYIQSLRAIFKCWSEGGNRLSFKGKYYNFSLMTPFFAPKQHGCPDVPIYIAGVNKHICRLAGELCDGLHAHPFHSPKYLKEFVVPNVEEGLRKANRVRQDCTIASTAFVVLGGNDTELEKGRAAVRQQISFYASTRTYRPVLEMHGWGDVALRLNEKAARGEWAAMADEITDEMVDTYAVTGTHDDIAGKLKSRYQGLLDRVALYLPYRPERMSDWQKLARQFRS